MEDLRKQLTSSDLFAVRGGKARRVEPISVPAESVVTISSSESSPSGVPSIPSQVFSKRRDNIDSTADDDVDDSAYKLQAPLKLAKTKLKRLVWSDDEDEGEKIVLPYVPAVDTKLDQTTFKRPPTIIKAPTNSITERPKPQDGPLWETFDTQGAENLYDPAKSAAEAERDLQELLSASMNDAAVEIDMRDAIVDGFQEGIRLLPHQVIGRKWMAERESGKKAGGILADDMGLGKTIQTLARIVDGRPRKADKGAGYAASTIVVCPVSLISQWASEIRKMAVGLRVIEHHGPSRTRDPAELKKAHIVITSYTVLSSEYDSYQQSIGTKAKSKARSDSCSDDNDSSDSAPFGRTASRKKPKQSKKIMDALFHIKWWRIVLDEAHNIKNRKTKAAIACSALEGKFRWVLTGTPMQNNVEELYSLLNFLKIRPLNDWDTFNNQINKPVKSGKSIRAMKRLQVVLKAVMLRRKKDSILNGKPLLKLPERIVQIVPCAFDAEEREFYESIASKVELTLNKFRQSGDIAKNYTSVLVLLLRLRQACNHPSLLSKDFTEDKEAIDPRTAKEDDDPNADDLADIFGQMDVSSSRRCQMCQQFFTKVNSGSRSDINYCPDCETIASKSRRKSHAGGITALPPDSAKIRAMLQILRKIRDRGSNEKTIIFSQFTSMLDLIQPFIRNEGLEFARYDGKMRKDQREESLRRIREDKAVSIILISFKAGSTGLNLTACNNVILVDLWWNPALEDQAFDRAHRFGQSRDVNIYKLTIEQTVEERILALQEKKRELAAAALSGDKLKNSRLGLDDLMALFKSSGPDDEDED